MRSSYTLTLTAAPDARRLTESLVSRIGQTLSSAATVEGKWLALQEAWQAKLTAHGDATLETLRLSARNAIGQNPIDVNVTPGEQRPGAMRLLVCDMESTIIEQEMLDELAGYVGLRDKISEITERTMRGELPFEASLRERVQALAGLPENILEEVYEKRVTIMPGATTLIETMKKQGAKCVLVSGGFTCFTQRVADHLGFDSHQANSLEIVDGHLTGRVIEPILGRQSKREALEKLAKSESVDLSNTVAVGDGANDLDMLSAAGLGVAFRAKPRIQEAAGAMPSGAVITYGDLSALLYLQGFAKE